MSAKRVKMDFGDLPSGASVGDGDTVIKMLYDFGNEHTDLTDGWKKDGYSWSDGVSRTILDGTKNSDCIYVQGNTNTISISGTQKKISLKNYSKIHIVVTTSSTGGVLFMATTSKVIYENGTIKAGGDLDTSMNRKKVTYDVSNIDDEVYFVFATLNNSARTGSLYEVYLEK